MYIRVDVPALSSCLTVSSTLSYFPDGFKAALVDAEYHRSALPNLMLLRETLHSIDIRSWRESRAIK